ncbi:MAG: hypothetical protein ACR2RE_00300 [Geminicoccaceae bacterium]
MSNIIRTTLGTATSKTSGTTLTLSDVTLEAEDVVKVVVGAVDPTNHQPSKIEWGSGNLFTKFGGGQFPSQAHGGSIWSYWTPTGGQDDIVITFPGAILARAMYAVGLKNTADKDVQTITGRYNDADPIGAPGGSQATAIEGEYGLGFVIVNGPVGDTAGTVVQGGLAGQRAGTTGAAAASNVTVFETHLQDVAKGTNLQIEINGMTARDSIIGIVGYEPLLFNTRGITTTDYLLAAELFAEKLPQIPTANHAFHLNRQSNNWEMHNISGIEGDLTTRIAAMDVDGNWVED